MKKSNWSFKKLNLSRFTIAELNEKNSVIGGASIRCTSIGCGNYQCKPREAQ